MSLGLSVSIPLQLPAKFGSWYLNGSIEYLHLAADNLSILHGGDRDELIGTFGLGLSF